jgi:hypothetical protein
VPAFSLGIHQRLTRPTSAHFRARHSPVSGQLCATTAGGAACRPGFLLPFGCRHSLLGPSCSRRGILLFSRSAYPSPQRCWDLDGVSMFRTNEIRVGSGAPCTPGLRCSHSRRSRFDCRCRFSAASPALRCFSHLPELPITKPQQGFTVIHPSTLPLACDPRTGRRLLGFPLGFAPHSYP